MPILIHADRPEDPKEDWIKGHWCSDFEVASLVARDLTTRFGITVKLDPEDNQRRMHLDFGGTMLGAWEPKAIESFSYWPHQLSMAIHSFHQALDNPRKGYVKIHGIYTCICMTITQAEHILSVLKSEAHAKEEERALELWEGALKRIGESPYCHVDTPNPAEMV